MLSEHTARFLGSWKKYFSGFSCSIWTRNIRRKSRTCPSAFLAVELKLPIIESLEKQQAKLKKYYAGLLKK